MSESVGVCLRGLQLVSQLTSNNAARTSMMGTFQCQQPKHFDMQLVLSCLPLDTFEQFFIKRFIPSNIYQNLDTAIEFEQGLRCLRVRPSSGERREVEHDGDVKCFARSWIVSLKVTCLLGRLSWHRMPARECNGVAKAREGLTN